MDFFSFTRFYSSQFPKESAPDTATPAPEADYDEVDESDMAWTEVLKRGPQYRRKYKLWRETQGMCIYCGKSIEVKDFVSGIEADIEHIVPQAIGGTSTLENLICSCRRCNRDKGELTAIDYMISKSSDELQDYLKRIRLLLTARLISKEKYHNLLRPKLGR